MCLRNGSYNSMWGILGMSSALGVPTHSIYPMYGGATVRDHINRLVKPRISTSSKWILFSKFITHARGLIGVKRIDVHSHLSTVLQVTLSISHSPASCLV